LPTGTLAVFWRRAEQELEEDDLSALEELALTAGKAIENARQFEKLHELAVRDPLTGLHNRSYFHGTLDHEVKRAHRYDRRLALIFFDLDDFKAINEDIGHLGGDSVLAEMAQRLRPSCVEPTFRVASEVTSSPSYCPNRPWRMPSFSSVG
jgi:PleD family two-component response regulator